MTSFWCSGAALWALAVAAEDSGPNPTIAPADGEAKIEFAVPVRMQAGGRLVKVEQPGYAAPCLADVDEDGLKDLVVGQFAGGKMQIFRNLGNGDYADGEWLMIDGAPAEVPGVW